MLSHIAKLALTLSISCATSHAAVPQASHPDCPDQDLPQFRRFDSELRAAVAQQNIAAMVFLVSFPLRVNSDQGTILIPDAQSLAGHFQQIWTAATRRDILSTPALSTKTGYICRYDEGIGYGHGTAWASNDELYTHSKDGHFAIYVINLPDEGTTQRPRLTYSCRAAKHHILIDEVADGKFRYRSWDGDKSLLAPPDIDLTNGKVEYQGSGVCVFPLYTFSRGNTTYEVEGGSGCGEGSDPKDAAGSLSVSVNGKQVAQVSCY